MPLMSAQGTRMPKAECATPAEQLVPRHHPSGHATGNLSMFPPQDDFKQNLTFYLAV